MKKLKQLLIGLLALAALAAQAQSFAPGQILTAAQLNSAFANVLPIAGGTLTGPLTVPTLTVTTALNTAHANITGGTITGLSSPLPVAAGGTNCAAASGTCLDNVAGFSGTGFITRTGAGAYAVSGSTGSGSVVLATSPALVTPNIGAATGSSLAATSNVTTPSHQTNLMGWPGAAGTYWQSQFHANWNVVQTQIANNPTEWQVYTNAAQGIAQTQSGTNQLVLQSGTNFSAAWVGFPYLYCDGTRYKVATFTDASHITVQTPAGGAVSFGSTVNCTYYFVATTTTSTVNVSGTAVTYVSGQPFVSIFDNGQVYINGTAYNATYNSPTSITLSTSAGTLTGATLNQYANINNELANLRVQGLSGANEENVALTLRPDGAWLQTLYAGLGKYRPMFFSVGENPAGTISPLISMYPAATIGNPGQLSLGGTGTNQAAQINQNANNVNYWLIQGGATGVSPSLAVRGTDATVGAGYDTQGANNHTFTSHNFANIEFQVFGSGGSNWLAVGSGAAPFVSANGAASNIPINLVPKGTGNVQINGSAIYPVLTGTTASIGGSALVAGACSSGTVTVTGATTSMVARATPVTYPGDGNVWESYVSATNTVTVKVCAIIAGTPTASTYNVRVLQ